MYVYADCGWRGYAYAKNIVKREPERTKKYKIY